MPGSRLIGRSSELTRLRALTGPGGESALVVLGEAGIGKSALLADLADYAGARGMRVLSAVGSEEESSLPLAGLQQLSPRTVASHLYRSFPKLGVAGRNQLHGLIPAADRAASTQIRTTIPAGKEPSP